MEVMEDEDMVVAILGLDNTSVENSVNFLYSGAGDLIGCDLEDQLSSNGDFRPRCGYLVRALTYCELKAIHLDHLIEVMPGDLLINICRSDRL